MKKILIGSLIVSACILAPSFSAHAQKKPVPANKGNQPARVAPSNGPGNVAVVIIGSAAKVAWGATKFVAKDLAAPVAMAVLKPVAIRAAPAVAKFALKKSAKYLLPLAVKLSIL